MTERTLPPNAILIPDNAECVFRGVIFDVYQWQQEMFDGSMQTYEMLRRPDSVTVIAIDENNEIITLTEEQPGGIRREHYIPGGRVDPEDETVLDAAKREFKEETGMEFADWRLLEVVQPEPKIEWFVHVFVARHQVGWTEPKHDVGERITIGRSSYDEVRSARVSKIGSVRRSETLEELLALLNDVGSQ